MLFLLPIIVQGKRGCLPWRVVVVLENSESAIASRIFYLNSLCYIEYSSNVFFSFSIFHRTQNPIGISMASGGTETFPDLGKNCQHRDCNHLDFLPYICDGCQRVFCSEHRSYKSHACPKSDLSRKVIVCQTCSMSIETTGYVGQDEDAILEKHHKSGNCDPTNKKKPICPVKGCKEILSISNTSTCKTCHLKVCLKHRFPSDHACSRGVSASALSSASDGGWKNFLSCFCFKTEQQKRP